MNTIAIRNLGGPSPLSDRRHWRICIDAEKSRTQKMIKDLNCLQNQMIISSWLGCPKLFANLKHLSFTQLIYGITKELMNPSTLYIGQLEGINQSENTLYICSAFHELLGENLSLAAKIVYDLWINEDNDSKGLHSLLLRLMKQRDRLKYRSNMCIRSPLVLATIQQAFEYKISCVMISASARIFLLGSGAYSHLVQSNSSDKDSFLGALISQDKAIYYQYMKAINLPMPRQFNLLRSTSDWEYFLSIQKDIGYPCVIKPVKGRRGEHVFADINSEQMLNECFMQIKKSHYDEFLIQAFVPGDDYRINFVAGKPESVIKRSKPIIIGDGKKSIEELICDLNLDRRNRRKLDGVSSEIQMDEDLFDRLNRYQYSKNTILKSGEKLVLRSNSNLSTGGLREEISISSMNTEIIYTALKIVNGVSLFNCGVDYITTDISLSPQASGGIFIEINSMPQVHPKRIQHFVHELFLEHRLSEINSIAVVTKELDNSLKNLIDRLLNKCSHHVIFVPFEWSASKLAMHLLTNFKNKIIYYKKPVDIICDKNIREAIIFVDYAKYLTAGLPIQQPQRIEIWTENNLLNQKATIEWSSS